MADVSPLDPVDIGLLTALQRDARTSLQGLARLVHLGPSATRARLLRLREHGLLTEYRAVVPPARVGFDLHAVMRMKVHGSLFDQVLAIVDDEPQVVRCLRITGESCYNVEIVARDMPDLGRITARFARIGSVTTDLVYEVVVDRPTPVSTDP